MNAALKNIGLVVVAGLVATFGFNLGSFAPASASAEVHFKDLSFAEAKKLAAKEHKKVMIDFYTDWCGWCKVLDRQTYSDDKVGSIADANFISVKINAEKGEGIELAKKSEITGYPTIIFYSADGSEIDRVVGYQNAGRFSRSLTLASSGGAKAVLDEVTSAKGTNDPNKWMTAANYYVEQKQNDKALSAFQKVVQLDADDKQKLKEEAQFGVAFLTQGDAQWPLLEQAVMSYPKRDEGRQAVMLLVQHDLQAPEVTPDAPPTVTEPAMRIMEMWAAQHPEDQNTFNFFAWTAAERGVMLPQAELYAERAVQLSKDASERASAMDTYAEVLFKEHRLSEALQKENDALAMLNPQNDKRLYNELTHQKAKFEEAASTASSSASGSTTTTTAH